MTEPPPYKDRPRLRGETAERRRRQIVEAAIAVIAEQGVQNLSLSEIEKKADMARGQLTYYFPTKESIFLGVFDHLVAMLEARVGTPHGAEGCTEVSGWDWVRHLLDAILLQPRASPEFHCLQYTFLSQIGHREDFRARLAALYEGWRSNMTEGLARDLPGESGISPRLFASLVQAILHGLSMQLAADPDAFDRSAMFQLCLEVLGRGRGLPTTRIPGPTGET